MSKQIIEIESFNPYETRFPNRKLVTRETLILMKYLREEGYEVKVLPDNDQPIEILYKKGLAEFFTDPIFIALIGIPIEIITNIVSNKIQKLIDSLDKKETINPEHLIIQINNSTHNYLGEEFPKEKKKRLKRNARNLKTVLKSVFK